ncbi:MAG: RDD family protein [Chlamydiae bacterium]|nr:RDD family protein [Chlamydiota bacterium]
MKAIEPSEILTGDDYGRAKKAPPDPWARLLARVFDYSLFCLLLLGLRSFLHLPVPGGVFERFIPFEFVFWIPIETLLLLTWGKTPGKWFLNIDLRFAKQSHPHWTMALRRSVAVWFRGLGMGIPVISLLCLLVAYQRLKMVQTTSWDKETCIQVVQQPFPRWRLIAASVFSIISFFFYWNF